MRRLDAFSEVAAWPAFDAKLIALGSREQSGLEVHKVGEVALTGMWRAEANVTSWLTYPCHEVMVVLEGQACIVTEKETFTFSPGDVFCLPKGLRCVWSQVGRVRKWFVATFDGDLEKGPRDAPFRVAVGNGEERLLWATSTGLQVRVRRLRAHEKDASRSASLIHVLEGPQKGETFFKLPMEDVRLKSDALAMVCSYPAAELPSSKL